MENPDCLQVVVTQKVEIEADRADLFINVKGSSWVNGRAALTQAREVSKLVADLKAIGVSEADIELRNVRAEVTSGILSKSSTAHYSLRVRCRALDRLDEILGTATAQKNVELQSIQWGYPQAEEEELARLEECLRKAGARAQRMAAALGVKLVGVHSVVETLHDSENPNYQATVRLDLAGGSMARARYGGELGVEVTHRKEIQHQVNVQYRVEGFSPP